MALLTCGGNMLKQWWIAIVLTILIFPTSIAQATTPTPVPTSEPMYSRTDLLAKIAPKPYSITPMFEDLDMITKVTDTTLDGTSWGLTFISILNAAGVQTFLIGLVILLMLVFWLRKTLVEKMNKREMSPAEVQFRAARDQFRRDVADLRKFNKSSRSSRKSRF